MTFYTDAQLRLQEAFDTTGIAAAIETRVMTASINEHWQRFIEAQDMVFIATVDSRGRPACSYKGGPPGFIRVASSELLVFPLYDGNGLFISAGNVQETSAIELLFVDFANPQRLRVGGEACLRRPDDLDLETFPEAKLIVEVRVEHVYVNCKRYVHRRVMVEASEYVPEQGKLSPIPAWKMLPYVLPTLSQADRDEIERRRAAGLPLPEPDGQPPTSE